MNSIYFLYYFCFKLKRSLIDTYEYDQDRNMEVQTEFVNKYIKIAKTEFENKFNPC